MTTRSVPHSMHRIKEHEASILEALGRGADPDVMEMLQEVGYVQ